MKLTTTAYFFITGRCNPRSSGCAGVNIDANTAEVNVSSSYDVTQLLFNQDSVQFVCFHEMYVLSSIPIHTVFQIFYNITNIVYFIYFFIFSLCGKKRCSDKLGNLSSG
nr:hypothetical protein Iba_chr12aCG22820 [Ipomoea batatas]